MSRLAKRSIDLPKGVELKIENGVAQAKGPKGSISLPLQKGIEINIEDGKVEVSKDEKLLVKKEFHGLYCSLIRNLVIGVSVGFEKRLSLIGVGYRAAVKGNMLDVQVGYSHPTALEIPKNIEVKVDKGNKIIVTGVDKQQVGQFAATVRALRPPEPYKGKGIRYEDEYVRKKAGKSAKAK